MKSQWYSAPFEEFKAHRVAEMLQELLPFANCTAEEIDGLVEISQLVYVKRDQILFEAGTLPNGVVFVSRGEVTVFTPWGGGEEIIAVIREGGHVGELGVMRGQSRSFAIRAKGGTQLLYMQSQDFLDILHRLPKVAEYFNRYIDSLPR